MRFILTLAISSFFIGISLLSYNYSSSFFHSSTCDHSHQGNHTHSHNDFCGFDTLMSTLSPQEQQLQQQLELQLADLMERGGFPPSNQRMVLTVPVVVHVVHNNGPGNIPNGQVFAGIQHLNDAFANVGVYNPATGVDVEIQFCLAQRDPNGNTTNGITNTISTLTNLNHNTQDLALKSVIRWNPNDYINIYVVNNIQGGVAGYAYLPAAHGNTVDGIVLEATYMGTNTDNSKVLVHEMGHYMGLYHTFHNGCTNNNCLLDGDQICDTPPDNTTAWVPCNAVTNSCTTDDNDLNPVNPFRPVANGGLGDQPDQKENYMDYSDFVCYDRFTANQKTRMRFFLQGTRASLLASDGCLAPCTTPINVGFTASATSVTLGSSVNFTNTTTGATNYDWLNNGTSFATTFNSSFTFNTIGTFSIVLEASNGDPNCTVYDTINIEVTCAAQAAFTASSTQVSPNDVVFFVNSSTGASSYQWYVNNALQGTGLNFNFTFPTVGTYDVFLIASDGLCADTSATTIITVSTSGLAQTGLPIWPLAPSGSVPPQYIDWRDTTPVSGNIPASTTTNGGQTGAAFNECGQLAFYALHTGSGNAHNLFIYAADGTPLLTNATTNAPGLDGVKAGQEIQVVKVPSFNDEWYIIYKKWTTDAGAPGGNGAYTAANWLYSRVQYTIGGPLNILQRDIPLVDGGGIARTYTDGAAVSRTAGGVAGQHYLYLCRRTAGVSNISLDRFLITNTNITWSANTGNVNVQWWNLTVAGSPIELSPPEDKIAVVSRNQSANQIDLTLFDANLFNAASAQTVSLGDLVLQPDGTAIDQSSILNISGAVDVLANNGSYPLGFLRNMEKKVNAIEFSPNGRFLYFTAGGYAGSGLTNVTYLGQIDLNPNPMEVRLQVQTVPSGLNMTTGSGCPYSSCLANWNGTGGIESCYDGNLYFTKRNLNQLFVIPDPNNFMPQNLVPSNIDISTLAEPNISYPSGFVFGPPDQIDGFNYLESQYNEVELIVQKLDCNELCDSIPYIVELFDTSGAVVQSFNISACPDTIIFCADTSLIYGIRDTSGHSYPIAIFYGQTIYPAGDTLFDFSESLGCFEVCDNGIDDDGDGLTDCYDPDCCNYCNQTRDKVWYFGQNAGLDFNSGTPVVINTGQLNTLEGCATLTSPNGTLLFYTDGVNVYDRSHTLMPNGTGLLGDPSATQSSIIVPHPSNATLYYIFTAPVVSSGNGIRYSIVDMTLNGGLGDVTATKNVQILSTSDEKLTAIKHCNNKDYWIVAHQANSNIFHVWSLDNTGLNTTSTTYPVGSVYTTGSPHGYLKASQDGSRLAAAIMMDATYELYDIDNSTGAISNPITMTDPAWMRAYGVEFSPDGNLLYASSCTDPSLLMQFDLSSGNAATIKASGVVLDSDAQYYSYGALQLAPDGKIYVARRHYPGTGPWWILNPSARLSAINNPNVQGPACTFVDTAIVLLPGMSELGLPNFIPSYHYDYNAVLSGPTGICNLPTTATYTLDVIGGGACTGDSIVWEHFGMNSILSQSDSNFVLNVTNLSIDTVIVHVFSECNYSSDTIITITSPFPNLDLGPDTSVCENGIVTLNAGSGFISYQWQDNSFDSTLTASDAGLYWVEAISACGDTLRDSIIINIDTVGLISVNDTSLCIGDTLQIVLPNTNNYQWFPNQDISCTNCNNPLIYPTTPITYTIVSNNSIGCFSVDSFLITMDTCSFITTIDTATCFGNFLSYNGTNYPPNSSDTILFTTSGGLDSFVVLNVLGLDTFNITIDTTVCLGDSLAYGSQFLMPNTSTVFNLQTTAGCDSIITVNVLGLDTMHTLIDTTICDGSTLAYNGQNLAAGSSTTFTFQTSEGCDSFVTININAFPITLTTNSTDASCNAYSDGQATVNASGGLGGFNYNWNTNPQTAPTATGLAAGLHCVTVTDSIGCAVDTCIQVNEPAGISYSIDTTNVTCFGYNDGQLTVNPSGGILPYTYLWSNGQTNNTATGLDANIHSVTITDANNCSITASAPITEPAGMQLAFIVDSVQCKNGSDGQIQAQVSGGIFPYFYQWNNSQNTALATGLTAGAYTLTVTDFNGCTISNSATVFEPLNVLSASIINQSNPLCNASCDGMIEVDAQGATPNYTYQWNNGQQTSIASGICAGTHTVTVTDANGCTISVGSVLTEPSAIVLTPQVLSNYNGSAITCPGANDGAVGVTAAGGNGGFSYVWSPNAQNTATINNLYQGTYCVTVSDVSGCQADTCITINDPTPLAATYQQVNILCKGDANGQILANATTGTGTLGINGYEYKIVGPNQTGNLYTSVNNWNNLAAGAYIIYVRDGNDCEIQLPIQITEPDSVLIDSVVISDALCFGTATGMATAFASGGVGGFTYVWSDGQTNNPATGLAKGLYSVTVADANGCDRVEVFNVDEPTDLTAAISTGTIACMGGTTTATATGSGGTPIALSSYLYNWSNGNTNSTAINLAAGVHCVTITDDNACTEIVCVTITEPNSNVTATIASQTAVLCQGTATGTATAQGVGGTAGYTYLWQTAPAQSTQTATGLAAGIFTVIVTDANGCSDQTSVTITEPSALIATILGTTNSSCFNTGDGTATVAASGGTPGYTYDWGNGQSGTSATGLAAGAYSVTISDANNCTTTAAFNIASPTAVNIVQVNTTDILCTGDATGSASISVNGGTPTNGYSYNWSGTTQTTLVVTGLSAGQHTVTATDFNGCFDIDTFIINEPAQALTGYLTSQAALCHGQGSGELGAIIQGGTSPYIYNWNTIPSQNTVVADSLVAGNYTVIVTDANGCSLSLAGTVGDATLLEVQANVQQQVTCFGGNNGVATASFPTGGTPNYTYVWTDPAGQSGQIATGLSAGIVSVVVTDANGCSASASVTITEDAEITLTENSTNVSCFGGNDGQIQITGSNKTIVNYNWGGLVGNPISNLTAGNYQLTVTDASGCQASFAYTITEPNALELDIQNTNSILCFGHNDASAQAFATGGTPNYTYAWSNNSNQASANNLAPGTYTVTATDSKGCIADTSIHITEPAELSITGIAHQTLCAGDQTGSITAFGTGGTVSSGLLQYSIDANNWQAGNVFAGLTAGIYTLSVQDQNGCSIDTQLVVEDANPFFITGLTPDTTVEYLDSIQIYAMLNDTINVIYSWEQITGLQALITNSAYQFVAAPSEEVTYLFTATNEFGCTVDSLVTIEVEKPRRANAPQGFTPNGDGVNDFFFIQGGSKVQEVLIFRVYDRWGELVYEGYNLDINIPNQGWNGIYRGKPASSGSYAWYADVLFKDGETVQLRGDVTLLR